MERKEVVFVLGGPGSGKGTQVSHEQLSISNPSDAAVSFKKLLSRCMIRKVLSFNSFRTLLNFVPCDRQALFLF